MKSGPRATDQTGRTDERPVASAPDVARAASPAGFGRLLARARGWVAGFRAPRPRPAANPARPTDPTLPLLPPEVAAARAAFRLPPRGRYEPPATLDQKRALERHGGRDYELIESLGDEQADHLLRHLAREAAARSARAGRTARRARFGLIFTRTIFGLVAVDLCIVGVILFRGGTLITQDSVILEPRHARARPSTAPPTAAVAPAHPPRPPTPARSTAFLADVGYSKAKALTRYPALGVPGTTFNARFVARYQAWHAAHDLRLERSNWPEILADDCASSPIPGPSPR